MTRRPQTKQSIAVGVLTAMGHRLSSEERPPYEVPEHDTSVNLDEVTGPLPILPTSSSTEP